MSIPTWSARTARAAGSLLVAALLLAACGDDNQAPDFGTTIACAMDSDCPAELPVCEPIAKVCVGCISGQMTCPNPGDVCDDTTHTCHPGDPNAPCRFNADCDFPNIVCDKATGKCVSCVTDDDCPDPTLPFCDSIFDGSTFTCEDDCMRCRGALPICQRDLGVCCDVDGGSCQRVM